MTVDLVKLYRSARCKDVEQLDPLFGDFIGTHQAESEENKPAAEGNRFPGSLGQ